MSRKFNFSLQKLLEFRDRKETSRSNEFKHTHNELELEKQRLLDIQERKIRMLQESADDDHNSGSISLNQIKLTSSYVDQLSDEIDAQERRVEGSEQKMESAREELIVASKDKMIIEQLREKHVSEHAKQAMKFERIQESETALRISRKGL